MVTKLILPACGVVVISVAVCVIWAGSSGEQPPRTQVSAWTGRPGTLGPSGTGQHANGIYGKLRRPDEVDDRDLLVVWEWEDGELKEKATYYIPRSLDVVLGVGSICGHTTRRECGAWPFVLRDLEEEVELKEWGDPQGWSGRNVGTSADGRFMVMKARERTGPRRIRLGIVDVVKRQLRWTDEIPRVAAGSVRTVTVTDDGRYVALAGWDNGVALVDAEEAELLWWLRPPEVVTILYAVFSPDGDRVHALCSRGVAFEIDVKSGDLVAQRSAVRSDRLRGGARVSAIALSSDGKWLAGGSGPWGEVYLWNLEEDKLSRVIRHGQGTITVLSFSPDSRHLAAVGGGVLIAWQIGEDECDGEHDEDSLK